ncbi:MAG: metallophosphoesterase family protein [Candidatus Omnitrophota bacterium]
MRYGIFSDTHSNLEALNAVIEAYRKEGIDEYLCVGDIVGYAADPKECILTVRSLAAHTVAGNHDWAAVDLLSTEYFNETARDAVAWTTTQLSAQEKSFLKDLPLLYKNEDLTLVHSTLENPQEFGYIDDLNTAEDSFWSQETPVCFVGHTHDAGVFIKDRSGKVSYKKEDTINLSPGCKYIINAGSVGQPRDLNPKACYCVFDTSKKKIFIKRAPYDIAGAQEKIIAAGLPQALATRLEFGR